MTKKHYLVMAPVGIILGVLFFVMLLSMSVVPITNAASNTVKLYTKSGSVSVYKDSSFTVQIRLLKSTTDWVNYVSAYVSYDPSMLSIVGTSTAGSAFSNDGGPTIRYSNTNGSLTVVGTSPEYVPTPSDSLVATVSFRAKKTGKTAITINQQSQAGRLVGQVNVKDHLMATSGTSVAITNPPAPAPEPQVVVPPSTIEPEPTENKEVVDTEKAADTTPLEAIETELDVVNEEQVASTDKGQPEASEVIETGASNWLYWLAAAASLLAVSVGAVFLRRRYVADRQMQERILRNIYALGGTAQYAAEYLQPEQLARRVFEYSQAEQQYDEELNEVAALSDAQLAQPESNEPLIEDSVVVNETIDIVAEEAAVDIVPTPEPTHIDNSPQSKSASAMHLRIPARRRPHIK